MVLRSLAAGDLHLRTPVVVLSNMEEFWSPHRPELETTEELSLRRMTRSVGGCFVENLYYNVSIPENNQKGTSELKMTMFVRTWRRQSLPCGG